MKSQNRYLLLGLIGVSNGITPLLIGSTMFVWLKELGLDIKSIGLYGLANLPFAFSFAISALLEYCTSNRFFNYKYILVSSLMGAALSILLIPAVITNSKILFFICLLLSIFTSIARIISTALQKILFDDKTLVIAMNVLTIGYKSGILIAGSLALFLSQWLSWTTLYHYLGLLILILTAFIAMHDHCYFNLNTHKQSIPLLNRLINPFKDLYHIPQIGLILALMFCYRAPDNLLTNYFDLFYLHYGLSKTNVAIGYKLYGMLLASLGGIICIRLIRKHSYLFNLNLALFLHLISYILIYWFSYHQGSLVEFYLCVSAEELSRGMTMIIFWSYQTQICKRQHVVIQLAILTGVDSLSYSLLGSLGGSLIASIGYSNFILIVISSFFPAFYILKLLG